MIILVLCAGPKPVQDAEDAFPVWLVEHRGEILLERLLKKCHTLGSVDLVFAIRANDARQFHVDNIISVLEPSASIVNIRGVTKGAAFTALLCIHRINPDKELLILNANEYLDADFEEIINDFRKRNLDAGTVVFPSVHPRYSYVRLDPDGQVIEAAEKKPISKQATVGFYWYRKGQDFIDAVQDMIRKDANVEGSFYICPAFNEMILAQKNIGVFPVDSEVYHPLKSLSQIRNYQTKLV